jgi:protein-S-isoprenylcysteine O-methyltransferase Ste14
MKQQPLELLVFFVLFSLALFLLAGTIAWLAGWVFLVLFLGFYVTVTLWLYRHNPGLMQERLRLGTSDQQGWDKTIFSLMLAFPFVWLAFTSMDAIRFHWSAMPGEIQLAGALILLGSFCLLFLTFRENTFLSPVVRIQEEHGQSVVSTGPYHIVRHPMYMAILIFVAGDSILLGSWYGLLPGGIYIAIIARRAVLEERTLRDKLPGYASYMEQVKYCLIPYLW